MPAFRTALLDMRLFLWSEKRPRYPQLFLWVWLPSHFKAKDPDMFLEGLHGL